MNSIKSRRSLLMHIFITKAINVTVTVSKTYQCYQPRTNLNPLTPNDSYSGRTAPLTSKRCILYIYSTYAGTEYFKHVYTLRFSSSKCSLFHNSNIFGSYIIHILYTECAKIKKKNNSGAKRLTHYFPLSLTPNKEELFADSHCGFR